MTEQLCRLGKPARVSLSWSCSDLAEGQLVQHAPNKGLVRAFNQLVLVQGVRLVYGAALAFRPRWHAPQLLQNGLHLVEQALHQPAPLSRVDIP